MELEGRGRAALSPAAAAAIHAASRSDATATPRPLQSRRAGYERQVTARADEEMHSKSMTRRSSRCG